MKNIFKNLNEKVKGAFTTLFGSNNSKKPNVNKDIIVYSGGNAIFNMPFDEFINNHMIDKGQLFIDENEKDKSIEVSIPKNAFDHYNVMVKAIYDDSAISNVPITGIDDTVYKFGPVNITNMDKCYVVTVNITVADNKYRLKHYILSLETIYNYDVHQYIDPIEYFKVYTDSKYQNEIEQVTVLESSSYNIYKDVLPLDKIYICPEPRNGSYMIRTYDNRNNVISERKFDYTNEDSYFIYDPSVYKVVLYKLNDQNVDAISIFIK